MQTANSSTEIELLYALQVGDYIHLACVALVAFDHLQTLPLEVEYIWTHRLTPATGLYYLMKYGIFIDAAIVCFQLFAPNMDLVKRCPISTWVLAYVYLIGIWIGEGLLGLIVWAVWLKNRYLTVAMPVTFTAVSVIGLIGLSRFVKSLRYSESPSPRIANCLITQENTAISLPIVCIMIWLSFMFTLLMIRAVKEYKFGGNTKFTRMIYEKGLQYYFYLFIVTFVCFLVVVRGPPGFFMEMLAFLARFLQVALISRIFLHTRRQATKNVVILNEVTNGEIRWTSSCSFAP